MARLPLRRFLTVTLVVAGLAGALAASPVAGNGSTTAVIIELTDPGPGALAALPEDGVEVTAVLLEL
ncbi:MAG: hypothetical protein GWN79_12730, partial [Actinobacteria bacterium]|nr:hypothetical protein [Actinomycetota bacterium]NIS32339.1 hypothetical protein [Actinomycetota bacterium]NIT96214.1 hypothetical protein [Actinomycetota bacterium]NIU19903.1 hypothetical protein [Actinomycetota bacterium]NIU67371.1 hypothetical protein [Actinomycetota bacterium]